MARNLFEKRLRGRLEQQARQKQARTGAAVEAPAHDIGLPAHFILDNNHRYLQLAFNDDLRTALSVVPRITRDPRILVEAGTPFIKREGMQGVSWLTRSYPGIVVADIKVSDGALGEVEMVAQAGAKAMTVLGNSPVETLRLFIEECKNRGILSMIDMLGVDDPISVLRPLYTPPDIVVIHRGRDEESNRAKMIHYRHISKIRSNYDVLISAAGGVDLKEARTAIFNGANIVVVNVVKPGDPWGGMSITEDIKAVTEKFLETIA